MVANDGHPGEVIEKMSMLLKRIKDFVQTHESELVSLTSRDIRETPVIPNDFHCPIYWELMGDPIIMSTGQGCCAEYITLVGDDLASIFLDANLNFLGAELSSSLLFAVITALAVLPTVWFKNISLLSYLLDHTTVWLDNLEIHLFIFSV
ncbi:uncharacterized protein LOC121969902 [Zingiber officinale]|uniref:uncharacterized protein LOC121969902 n=1 Tax=Zingiber officinale TaxID=94328 RepID=UPI001C4B1050|nr:uncharacterized protein LOC121969902 [Zingiber officinale]